MASEVKTGELFLDESGVSVRYEPGVDKMRVELFFFVDGMAWEAAPEADPVLGALRMAEGVVTRLKAEAFNRSLRKPLR